MDANIHNLLQRAPNSFLMRQSPFLPVLAAMAAGTRDLGKNAIRSGYLERVDLSGGGSYRLTGFGEKHAEMIANDMIRRA